MISRHRQFHWYPTPRLWSWPRFGASSCAWGHAAHPRLTTEDHIGILGLRYSARRIRNLDGLIREHIVRISYLSKTWPASDWVDIYRCSRHFEYEVVIERNFKIPFSVYRTETLFNENVYLWLCFLKLLGKAVIGVCILSIALFFRLAGSFLVLPFLAVCRGGLFLKFGGQFFLAHRFSRISTS